MGAMFLSGQAGYSAGNQFEGFEWQNPIHFDSAAGSYGDRVRDPHIIRVGDTYYLTHTMTPCGGSEQYDPYKRREGSGPGVRMYSTKDFKTWKAETWIVKSDELPPDCPYRNQCWAPEINAIGGKFYAVFYAANWKSGIPAACFVGVADKVTGPYKHITELPGAGCDVTFAEDDDGKVYAFMIGNGIRVQQVDLSGIERGDIRLLGQEKLVIDPAPREAAGTWYDRWTEGPWVKRRSDGKYYLFAAVHVRGQEEKSRNQYWMAVAYADHPMGPWKLDKNPGIFWGGHGSIFDGPDGRWWACYKNEKFDAVGEDFLCIDPLNFLPDGRVAVGEPTPYNISTRIDADGSVHRTEVAPKAVPVDQRPAPLPTPEMLEVERCDYPAKRIADWDFQRSSDGAEHKAGLLGEGDWSLQNSAGDAFAAKILARPDGAKLVEEDGKLLLDTSGGCVLFPRKSESAILNTNKHFSIWMRVKPERFSDRDNQGLATTLGRWKITRTLEGRLVVSFGPHMSDILEGRGPILPNDKWADVAVTFEGNADPSDLHKDEVTVYVDGKVVGKQSGRAMFNDYDSFQIGGDWYDGNNRFQGVIQRVIFWDGVVQSPEIAALSEGTDTMVDRVSARTERDKLPVH